MTAHHYPGGPLWQPDSRSGVHLDADRVGAFPVVDESLRPRSGGAAALFDASFSDEAVARRRAWAKAAAARRLEEVRTSAAARQAWLDSFPPEWRAEMDRRLVAEYGQIGASA